MNTDLCSFVLAVPRRQRLRGGPGEQVGACIVSADNVILGIGYNGFPRGCPDTKLPWAKLSRSNNALDTKYPYVCHAELNAVLNKNAATLHGAVRG